MAFYGFVTIGGSPAPDGTQVSVRIGGREYAKATTSGAYGPGSYSLTVPADNPATPDNKEGGAENELVELYVGTTKAAEARFKSGGIVRLDLAVEVAPPPLEPAAFEVSDLSISPASTQAGEPVSISFIVTNTGDEEGTYTVTLKVNGEVEATREVTLAGGAEASLTFTVIRENAGTYEVEVDGLSGSFTLISPPPPVELEPAEFVIVSFLITPTEVETGEVVLIVIEVKNVGDLEGTHTLVLRINGEVEATREVTLAGGEARELTFSVTREEGGTYQVEVDGAVGTFEVRAPPPPPSPEEERPGVPVGGIAVIAIAFLVLFVVIKRLRLPQPRTGSRPGDLP
jgi:hypothetical protein